MERIPPTNQIFEDVNFRNWVNEVGLVLPMNDIDLLDPQLKMGKHFTPVEEGIFNMLTKEGNRAHVIPKQELMNGCVSVDSSNYVKVHLSRLKDKFEDASAISNIWDLGYSFGVEDHSFKPAGTARLINGLFYHFSEEVPSIYLGGMLGMTGSYLAVTVNRFNNSRLDTAKVRILRYSHFTKLTWV